MLQDGLCVASQPDRDRTLDWQRGLTRLHQGMPFPFKGDRRLGPHGVQNIDLFLDLLASLGELRPHRAKLSPIPSNPEAQAQASLTQHVHRRGLFG